MPRIANPENLNPEKQETLRKKAESKRRDELSAMAEADRKARIAQQLQKATDRAEQAREQTRTQTQTPQTPEKAQQKKPSRHLFNRIAELMLQEQQKELTQEKPEVELETVTRKTETSMRALNFLMNKESILEGQQKETIRDNMRDRLEAQMSLVLARNAIVNNPKFPPEMKKQALVVVNTLISQNDQEYKVNRQQIQQLEGTIQTKFPDGLSSDRAELEEQRKKVKDKEEDQKGEKKKPTKIEQQKQLRAKRVSNYRDLKKLESRIEELKQKKDKATVEQEELAELERQRESILLEQFQVLSKTEIIDTITGETEKKILDSLTDSEFMGQILKDGNGILLKSEKQRLKKLQSFLQTTEGQKQISVLKQTIDSGEDQDVALEIIRQSPELQQALESLAHPETGGRVELLLQEREAPEELQRLSLNEMAQEFADYEYWRLHGPIEQRIAAVEEEFMAKILTLNVEDMTDLDLYLTLERYGLAEVGFNGKTNMVNTKIRRDFDLGPVENTRNILDRQVKKNEIRSQINDMIQRAEHIRRQHQTGWEIVGYDSDKQFETQQRRHEQLIQDVQVDLARNFARINTASEQFGVSPNANFLQELFDNGTIDLQTTPTGLSIVVNSYNVGLNQERSLYDLLRVLGHQDQAAEQALSQGLGVTLTAQALTQFQNSIEGGQYNGLTETELPTVNIIVLPNDPTQRHMLAHIQRHETTDYLIEAFDTADLEINQNEQEEFRALRELTSRITDHTVAASHDNGSLIPLYLDDLYLEGAREFQPEKQTNQEALFNLVRATEAIIFNKVTSIEDYQTRDLQEELLRGQVAARLREKIRNKMLARAQEPVPLATIMDQITTELLQEHTMQVEYDKLVRGYQSMFNPIDYQRRHIPAREFHNYYMFSSTKNGTPGGKSFIGVQDTTNRSNKGVRGAKATSQFEGADVPPFYGPPGEAAINSQWEFEDRSTGLIPATVVIPGLRHIPIVRDIFMKIPLPTPLTRTYLFKRATSARFMRSFDPYLRKAGKMELVHEDLGANPAKIAALISPELEHRMKAFAPGYLSAHKISEGREFSPVSMNLGVMEHLYNKGPGWLNMLGVEDGMIDPKDMQRYIGAMVGVTHEFDGQQYRAKFDHNSLRHTTKIENSNLDDLLREDPEDAEKAKGTFKKHMARDKNSQIYRFEYDGKRYRPTEGMMSSIRNDLLRRGASKRQKEVSKFFKENARRSDLPSSTGNVFLWERNIGKNYRNYLKHRDGYLGLATLELESKHFAADKERGEHYSLFELVNLMHIGDQAIDYDGKAWKTADRDMTLTIVENGKKKKVKVFKGENLRDAQGNLIPAGVELLRDDKRNFIIKDGQLQANLSHAATYGLWGRLVGDYENPHLRYIRLNSREGMDFATDMFSADIDDGFRDKDNILLRIDGITEALHQMNINKIDKFMEEGVPPDKRYDMEMMGIEVPAANGEINKLTTPLIKFEEGMFTEEGAGGGTATRDFMKKLEDSLSEAAKYRDDLKSVLKGLKDEGFFARNDVTRYEASQRLEYILSGLLGQTRTGFDPLFKSIVRFDDDPSWSHPFRREQEAIDAISDEQKDYVIRTLRHGFEGGVKYRYEKGQNFLFQWQKVLTKTSQYERTAYAAFAHYKGTAKMVTRVTNLAMVASVLGMALPTTAPVLAWMFVGSLAARKMFKPWAQKEERRWLARRIKALERQQAIEQLDSVFAKAMEGGVPTEYEIKRMFHTCERMIWWLEELGTTKEADDWYPWDDKVIGGWDSLMTAIQEKSQQLAQA